MAISLEEIKENRENLEFFKNKLIKIEDIFQNETKVVLNDKELELFLNGVKLNSSFDNGICKIYNETNNFIGIGTINNNKLKRDVIV